MRIVRAGLGAGLKAGTGRWELLGGLRAGARSQKSEFPPRSQETHSSTNSVQILSHQSSERHHTCRSQETHNPKSISSNTHIPLSLSLSDNSKN